MAIFTRLIDDEGGATAVEYGLIAAMIALGCVAALQGLGPTLSTTFNKVDTTLAQGNAA